MRPCSEPEQAGRSVPCLYPRDLAKLLHAVDWSVSESNGERFNVTLLGEEGGQRGVIVSHIPRVAQRGLSQQ